MYIIPIINSVIPPISVEIFPIKLFIFFPIFKPIYVNIKLDKENDNTDNI